jgi:hypothetical protein
MKLIILLATGVLFSLCSCSSNENNVLVKEDVLGELIVKTRASKISETQAFKGSDIKSFNVKTGEITFINLTYHDICDSLAYDRKITFYLEEELLFTAAAVGSFSSFTINDLVFYYDGKRIYLKDGYPDFAVYSNVNEQHRQMLQAREEAAEKRKPAWERFIRYLNENNLLTDRDSDVPEDNDLPDIPVPSVEYDLSATITHEGNSGEWKSLVFIGKSILSFNPKTREIVFDSHNILSNLNELAPIRLDIFRDGNPLLSATIIVSDNPQTVNDLVFMIDNTKKQDASYQLNEFKYHILDGYPALENLESGREDARRIREENAQQREAEWNTFIRYLTDAGKIVK